MVSMDKAVFCRSPEKLTKEVSVKRGRGQRRRRSLEEKLLWRLTQWNSDPESKALGDAMEEKFLRAWDVPSDNPPWFHEVEPASLEEDLCGGTDAYITTSGGIKIPVQVKSSVTGMEKHLEKYPGFSGIIIVVIEEDTPLEIRLRTERLLQDKGFIEEFNKT